MLLLKRKPAGEKKKKSFWREWADAALFAIVAATIIRWLFLEAYTIPTPSMEKSLLVGDFLFVSKMHYGARTAKTPIQMPLTHQKIWFTDIPSYSTAIQLPQFRLPGFSEVKKGDVVVFNWPADMNYPTDLKTNYIKRCIAAAGDTIMLRQREVFVNGKPENKPEKMQYKYKILCSESINERIWEDADITDYGETHYGYLADATPEAAEKMRQLPFIKGVELFTAPAGLPDPSVFPHSSRYDWNVDNYGPLWVPKKGVSIPMTKENFIRYAQTIHDFENLDNVEIRDSSLVIDGKPVTEYTFRQNYYWMMGDNRHDSEDSRFWGFVPEDHVVGKAWFIWMSLEPKPGFILSRIRWRRLFNGID